LFSKERYYITDHMNTWSTT